MKQQVSQRTESYVEGRESMGYAGWSDMDAWLGYEFWSSQVEAEMEPWGEPESAEEMLSPERVAGYRKESDSDVRPF